jgi:glycerol-3-phosphate dehydrogenase (NAD(P)+)
MTRLAVIGGGAWGSALAIVAARAGAQATLWARDAVTADSINRLRENAAYLPGVAFGPTIVATTDLSVAAAVADAALIVVPAQSLRVTLKALAQVARPGLPLLLCAKGIETGSLKTMSEIAGELMPSAPVAVLSGPSFASEVAGDLPTAVTIASRDGAVAAWFVEALATVHFRPYSSTDPIGVEIGGAVKNVLAIACGIVEGRELGHNARAALITRGLAEITRLGTAKGARAETFAGLSGIGDLVLTCTTSQSRNYRLGLSLGRGGALGDALAKLHSLAEGVATAASVAALAARLGVEMPIASAVEAVLHRGMTIGEMIEQLLARPRRAE